MSRPVVPAAFLVAFAAIVGLGAADGGYFPSEWGLATLGFALVGITVLMLADVRLPVPRELAFVGALTLAAGWAAISALWSPGAGAPALEAERGVLYVAAAGAAILLLSLPAAAPALMGGVVAGTVALSLYGLAQFPPPSERIVYRNKGYHQRQMEDCQHIEDRGGIKGKN